MTDNILEVKGLTKRFGSFTAVDTVDISIRTGTIHAVIGPNGAGKSTLFKLITGVEVPSAGKVFLRGESIGSKKPHVVVRKGLVQVFQMSSVFTRLTVLESVLVGMIANKRHGFDVVSRYGRGLEDSARELLGRVGISELGDRFAGELSHGDQRALELAMALSTNPNVLMLDEPTAGMSPAETAVIAALIVSEARTRGITVVLSEHDMDVIFGISDHITVLHQGKVIADGAPEAIREVPEVMAVYLGVENKNHGDRGQRAKIDPQGQGQIVDGTQRWT